MQDDHHHQHDITSTDLAGYGDAVELADGLGSEGRARGGGEEGGRAFELDRGDGESFGYGGRK